MDITTYREANDLSRDDFGQLVGKSAESVRLWEVGERRPSPETAIKIEGATGGLVPKHQLRPDIWPTPDTEARAS